MVAAISLIPAARATDYINDPTVNNTFSNHCSGWSMLASSPYTAQCITGGFPSGYAFQASLPTPPPSNPGTLYSFAYQGGWNLPAVVDGMTLAQCYQEPCVVNYWAYIATVTFQYVLENGCVPPCGQTSAFYNVGWDFTITWSSNVGPCSHNSMDFVVDVASGANGFTGNNVQYFNCNYNGQYQVVLSADQVPSSSSFVSKTYDFTNLLKQAFCGPLDFFSNCTWNLPAGAFTAGRVGLATNAFFISTTWSHADFYGDHVVACYGQGCGPCRPSPCPLAPIATTKR